MSNTLADDSHKFVGLLMFMLEKRNGANFGSCGTMDVTIHSYSGLGMITNSGVGTGPDPASC